MCFKSKAKPRASSLLQNAAWLTMEGDRGARLPHSLWLWQGHRHQRQQQEQLGTAEPPACGLVTDATRVMETCSSSWEMAPSSHACSFSLLSKVSQSQCAEDISKSWSGCGAGHGEVVVGLASENKVNIPS